MRYRFARETWEIRQALIVCRTSCPLELGVLFPAPPQDVHHPRERPPHRLLHREPVDAPLVDVRVQPLLLPPPRNASQSCLMLLVSVMAPLYLTEDGEQPFFL